MRGYYQDGTPYRCNLKLEDFYLDLAESQGGDALRDGGHAEGSLQVLRRGRGAVVGHLARSGRTRPRGSTTFLQVAFLFIYQIKSMYVVRSNSIKEDGEMGSQLRTIFQSLPFTASTATTMVACASVPSAESLTTLRFIDQIVH